MKKSIIYSIAVVLLLASASYGCLIFSDDFNSEHPGINRNPTNWSVTDGTIDIIGTGLSGTFYDRFGGMSGYYLDLDGSTVNAGRITLNIEFEAGTYVLTFDLAGSNRNDTDTVDVYFDSTNHLIYTMSGFADWTTISVDVIFTETAHLVFDQRGGDNSGLLLDNVRVYVVNTADVPEPSVISLFILGLASFIGFRFKQKK